MGTFVSGANINTSNNYAYDAEGRLIKDVQEGIASIEWRVDGKVKAINRPSGSSKKNLKFDYDAMGHRIAKHILTSANVLEKSTYYILDAQGNIVSSYVREIISSTVYYSQKEKHIINGSFGVLNDSIPLYGTQNSTYSQTVWAHSIGKRNYDLSNHLGNVLSVITDKPILHGTGGATSAGTVVDYFMADILQTSDYTPFGVTIPERNLKKTVSGVRDYTLGFQGQLEDDEIKGEGNSLNYEYRMHDPRLGRFFAVDPLCVIFPWNSSYAFSENRVIDSRELEGLECGQAVSASQLEYIETGLEAGMTTDELLSTELGGRLEMALYTGIAIAMMADMYCGGKLSTTVGLYYLGNEMNATDRYHDAVEKGDKKKAAYYKTQMKEYGPESAAILAGGLAAITLKTIVVTGSRSSSICRAVKYVRDKSYRALVNGVRLFSKIEQRVTGNSIEFLYKGKRIGESTLKNGILEMDFNLPEKLRNKGMGTKMFNASVDNFDYDEINGIRGLWTSNSGKASDNLDIFWQYADDIYSEEQAALKTVTGKWAKEAGFTNAKVIYSEREEVEVLFTKP